MREGRPYEPRIVHPVFPADVAPADALTLLLQSTWNDLEALMKPAELAALKQVTSFFELQIWLQEFWTRRDPAPTTDRNERRQDHRERLALARSLFGSPQAPYYDARGRALIRFGKPEMMLSAPAEVTARSYEPPVEVWRIEDMILGFQSFANSGVYMPSGMPEARASMFYTLAGSSKGALVMLENYEIADEAGQERYEYRLEGVPLWAAHSIDFFRLGSGDGKKSTLMRIYYQLRGDELTARKNADTGGEEWKLQQALALVDPETQRRIVRKETRTAKAPGRDETQLTLLSGLFELPVTPGAYDLTFHLHDSWGEGEQIFIRRVEVPHFASDSLALSDISLFLSELLPDPLAAGEMPLGLPHPVASYQRGMKLAFYYEIYGLKTGRRGRTDYIISYAIESPGEKGMSSTFHGRSDESTVASSLVIDTTHLEPGDYTLSVTVTDEICRLPAIIPERCRAGRQRRFQIVD